MEWQLALVVILGSLVFLMLLGIPVAFAFLAVNIVGVFLFWGGETGLWQLIHSIRDSITSFTILPIPLFLLLGEVMFHSGVASRMIDTVDMWLGRLPGRLGLLAVGTGTLWSTLSGSAMATVAMMGAALVPEMEKRGYKKPMSLGPILAAGGLDTMIPPSTLGVLLGAIGGISIGAILIAIIIPGLIMAVLYAAYIIVRCWLQPSLAPPYEVPPTPIRARLLATVRYILPLSFIIFLVTGVIFFGIATPSEAAATGTLGAFIAAWAYGGLNWKVIKDCFSATTSVTVMIFMIIMGALAFGQVLAFIGATRGMMDFALGLPAAPIVVIMIMQIVLLFMGMFMSVIEIMMITLPIFVPVVDALGLNLVWFAVIYLLNMEIAGLSPPFGMLLFVMKGQAPAGTTMGDVIRAGLPFVVIDLVLMVLIMFVPSIALWLPGIMRPVS